jgi:hypothetical protein
MNNDKIIIKLEDRDIVGPNYKYRSDYNIARVLCEKVKLTERFKIIRFFTDPCCRINGGVNTVNKSTINLGFNDPPCKHHVEKIVLLPFELNRSHTRLKDLTMYAINYYLKSSIFYENYLHNIPSQARTVNVIRFMAKIKTNKLCKNVSKYLYRFSNTYGIAKEGEYLYIFIADYIYSIKKLVTCRLLSDDFAPHINSVGIKYIDIILDYLEKNCLLPTKNEINENAIIPNWKITYGCDPEFEIIMNKRIVRADENGFDRATGSIGADGAGAQLELRPRPSDNIDNLIRNITKLFARLKISHPQFALSTIGNTFPLGGHIHVGIKDKKNANSINESLINKLVKLFDYYIGELVLNTSGDARQHYKTLGACEQKDYGFEYRTPPSTIFTNPTICRIIYNIIDIIIKKFLNGEKFEIDNNIKIIKRIAKLGIKKNILILLIKYMRRITNILRYDENIIDFWLNKRKEKKNFILRPISTFNPIRITFSSHDAFCSYLTQELESIVNKIKTKRKNAMVHFIGLKEERGITFLGIDVPGIKKTHITEIPKLREASNELIIGFPYIYRINKDNINVENPWDPLSDCLINKIMQIITNKIIERFDGKCVK